MRATLADRTTPRFSETARSRPGSRETRGHGAQVCGLLAVRGRRRADDLAEGPAERAETRKAHVEADLGHAAVGLPEQEHRPLHSAALQIAVGRLAEGGPEGADEVGLRYVGDPGE